MLDHDRFETSGSPSVLHYDTGFRRFLAIITLLANDHTALNSTLVPTTVHSQVHYRAKGALAAWRRTSNFKISFGI